MTETWRRDVPQWHNGIEVPWGRIAKLRFGHGIEGRVLSSAPDIEESASLMFRLPPGWTFAPPEESGTLEIFVTAGSITVQGRRLGVGGFVAIPGGCAGAELCSPTGALVMVFWNQFPIGACYPDGDLHVIDNQAVPWTMVEAENIPHGTFFKPLRTPYFCEHGFGGLAGNLTLVASLPAFHTHDGEHHDAVWEEIICLAGDTCFPLRGSGGPGTVINNPPWFEHGPFGTQRGHLTIMQALSPIRVNRAHIAGGPEAMAHYHDSEPLFAEPHWTDDWNTHVDRRKGGPDERK